MFHREGGSQGSREGIRSGWEEEETAGRETKREREREKERERERGKQKRERERERERRRRRRSEEAG